MDSDQHPENFMSVSTEEAYNSLLFYRFAQQRVKGKSVACIGRKDIGYGSFLLAETGKSVESLTNSPEILKSALALYPGANITYREANLPELPYPDNYFDVVTAFGIIETFEPPEALVEEAKRVLKQDGLLIVSTPDKQTHSNNRNYKAPSHAREMYATEFREILEQYFGQILMYRQGTVAGGLVQRDTGNLSTTCSIESTTSTSTVPSFDTALPTTHFVIALCGNQQILDQEDQQSYLLLDRERRVFEECEDLSEDVQLLQEEIQRMQETEVQAFQETLKIRNSEIARLRAQLERSESQLERSESQLEELRDQTRKLKTRSANLETHIHNIESSRTWRVLGIYRTLRAQLGTLLKLRSSRGK